jgi:hypothetical protein
MILRLTSTFAISTYHCLPFRSIWFQPLIRLCRFRIIWLSNRLTLSVYLMNVVLPWTLSVPDKCCPTFDIECTKWMLFYFWLWVYLINVVPLLTECTRSTLFYFWLWVYLMNVVLLLTLSVPDECCSTFDIECTWWMLFYFWLSVPDECCSTFDFECTWWMLFYSWLWV